MRLNYDIVQQGPLAEHDYLTTEGELLTPGLANSSEWHILVAIVGVFGECEPSGWDENGIAKFLMQLRMRLPSRLLKTLRLACYLVWYFYHGII